MCRDPDRVGAEPDRHGGELSALARAAITGDPRTALLLGQAAQRVHPDPETRFGMAQLLRTTRYVGTTREHVAAVHGVAYAPDGHTLATSGTDGRVMVWNVADRAHPLLIDNLRTATDDVLTVAFSPDGRILAARELAAVTTATPNTANYLLREHAGLEARIEAPDDWRDPEPDRASLRDEQPAATPARVPLRAGQNVAIDDAALTITISWRPGAHDLDASAILLNRNGWVRSDADFVFYNQPATPDGAIRHTQRLPAGRPPLSRSTSRLNGLPLDIHRVVAAVSVDGGRFANVHDLRVTATTTSPATEYVFQPAVTVETALVCLEVYRRDGTWRLRAIGQGYADGLAGLARDFGVDVA